MLFSVPDVLPSGLARVYIYTHAKSWGRCHTVCVVSSFSLEARFASECHSPGTFHLLLCKKSGIVPFSLVPPPLWIISTVEITCEWKMTPFLSKGGAACAEKHPCFQSLNQANVAWASPPTGRTCKRNPDWQNSRHQVYNLAFVDELWQTFQGLVFIVLLQDFYEKIPDLRDTFLETYAGLLSQVSVFVARSCARASYELSTPGYLPVSAGQIASRKFCCGAG